MTMALRDRARAAVKKHFLDQMDEETKAWRAAALFDLYNGPSGVDGPEGYTYTKALKELDTWWSQNGGDVWFDTQSEQVLDKDPTTDLDDEGQPYGLPEDTMAFDSSAAKKIVFGELITDGGMRGNPKRPVRKNYDPADSDGAIEEGMAATLWADQWANHVDEHRCTSLSRVEITSVMPPIPAKAYELAIDLMVKISKANGVYHPELSGQHPGDKGMSALLATAAAADGVTPDEAYMRSFGSDLALMALGHGVSWFSDHATFPLKVPSFESYDLLEIADARCDGRGGAKSRPTRRR